MSDEQLSGQAAIEGDLAQIIAEETDQIPENTAVAAMRVVQYVKDHADEILDISDVEATNGSQPPPPPPQEFA